MIPLRDVIPSRTRPVVTILLIALNAVVFLRQAGLGADGFEAFIRAFGLVPAAFSWLSVVSSMFVHAGFMHFVGNMLYLWIFGDNVEDRMGHGRFLAFYLLCGAGAALAQTSAVPESLVPMVGASGAIAGVMGAYFVLYPKSRVLTLIPFPITIVEIPALYLLGLWFVMQFVNGVGALLVFVFRRRERQRVEWWDDSTPGR
jgi:membrane associated rhomboid family serine protease